jgi:hypothetical protein
MQFFLGGKKTEGTLALLGRKINQGRKNCYLYLTKINHVNAPPPDVEEAMKQLK